MGVGYNPKIVTNGLMFAVDAANIKSLNIPSQADSGYSEWVCLDNGTATYSIVSSGVTIYQRSNVSVVTTVVSTSTGPTRGSISVIAGYSYYGIGGPINLVTEGKQHCIAPLTMASNQFYHYASRGDSSQTFYVYSPYSLATVNFMNAPASGGINATPTSNATIGTGNITTFTGAGTGSYFFTSNVPVIITVQSSLSQDQTILSPPARYVYQRYAANNSTVVQTTPSNAGTYVVYDTTYNVMTVQIADGSGGDAAQGLGYEFLSDRYSWGNVCSDYVIVAPYPNTYITTYYWDGTYWQTWDTHSLSGTQTSPASAQRDGSAGPGVAATNINGTANNMVSGSTVLWKWEGTNPFYLCINDNADDEFSVLGWLSSRTSTTGTSNSWKDITGNNNHLTIYGGPVFNKAGYMTFLSDQISQYMMNSSFPFPTSDNTMECWFYTTSVGAQTPLTYSVAGDNSQLIIFANSTTFQPWTLAVAYNFTVTSIVNQWIHVARTRIKSSGLDNFYINGKLVGSGTTSAGTAVTTNGYLIVGQEADSPGGGFDANQNLDGNIGRISIYNRALTAEEIQQNFNATRARYGV